MLTRALCVVASLGLVGCSTVVLEISEPLDVGVLADFEAGHTSRTEVLRRLGPPAAVARHGDGAALLYEFVALDEGQLGIGLDMLYGLLPWKWLELFKFSSGDSDVERDAIAILFDRDGVLVGVGTSQWGEDYGSGNGLQFFIAVESVVDSASLRRLPRSLTWGDEMLAVPPVALSVHTLPDLELRGTPASAGQQRSVR